MTPETPLRPFLGAGSEGRSRYAHGDGIAAHQHREGQLLYAAAGVLVIAVAGGTLMAPTDRIAWTPPGFEHSHRVYGETEVRILEIPGPLCAALPARPVVFAVGPLLREAVIALTDGRPLPPGPRGRLRRVVVDQLTDIPGQPLYLPEPADDRLRAATGVLHANPADQSTLADLGRAVGASERTGDRHRDRDRLGQPDQLHRGLHRGRRPDSRPLPGRGPAHPLLATWRASGISCRDAGSTPAGGTAQ